MITQRTRCRACDSVAHVATETFIELTTAFAERLRQLRAICRAFHDGRESRNHLHPEREPISDPGAGKWTVCDCLTVGSTQYVVTHFRSGGSSVACTGPCVSRGWELLTPRERTIVESLASGAALKAVAFDQAISVQAVSTYLARARRKLGVRSRADLIRAMRPPDGNSCAGAAEVVLAQFEFDQEHFRIIEKRAPPSVRGVTRALTPAEQEILTGILRGLRNAEIARLRATSARTVGAQVSALMTKLGATSRAEIVAMLLGGEARTTL